MMDSRYCSNRYVIAANDSEIDMFCFNNDSERPAQKYFSGDISCLGKKLPLSFASLLNIL